MTLRMRVKWKAWSSSTLSSLKSEADKAKMSQPQVKRPRLENMVSYHELTYNY